MLKRLIVWIVCFSLCWIPLDGGQASRSPGKQAKNESNQQLHVHFIDVGQGDSMLIETANGKKVLIDGGPPDAGDQLLNYLKQQEVSSIDMVIATHPDIDHIGGLVPLLKNLKVNKVIDSGKLYYTWTFFEYVNQVRKNKIPISIADQNEKIKLDTKTTLTVLNTFHGLKTNNQSSIALKLTHGDVDFLLAADIGVKQEKILIKDYNINAEILKVAHHGSGTSSSLAFLQAVKPEIAILSYGKNNDYGHPLDQVVAHIKQVGATIYSTANSGDIVISTDGDSYTIKCNLNRKDIMNCAS